MEQTDAIESTMFDAVLHACGKIRTSSGALVGIRAFDTDYVVPGRSFVVDTSNGLFQFWFGMNAPRLMFYALVEGRPYFNAEDAFRYMSASAGTVSWDILCEPLDDRLWGLVATSSPEHDVPLVTKAASHSGDRGAEERSMLTDRGRYWVQEAALLVQGWLRTCERHRIRCSELAPMPF